MDDRTLLAKEFPNVIEAWLDVSINRIEVEHDGSITWDTLQEIKDYVWGIDALAIEVYPPKADVINTGNYRHLWLWTGNYDQIPSMTDTGAR